jgi:hypothetical protein
MLAPRFLFVIALSTTILLCDRVLARPYLGQRARKARVAPEFANEAPPVNLYHGQAAGQARMHQGNLPQAPRARLPAEREPFTSLTDIMNEIERMELEHAAAFHPPDQRDDRLLSQRQPQHLYQGRTYLTDASSSLAPSQSRRTQSVRGQRGSREEADRAASVLPSSSSAATGGRYYNEEDIHVSGSH